MLPVVFSNSYRTSKIFILLSVIFMLCICGYLNNPEIRYEECLSNPEYFDGTIIEIKRESKVGEVKNHYFQVIQGREKLIIFGETNCLVPGDDIRVTARFHKDGKLELLDYYIPKLRKFKIYVSFLATCLLIFLFLLRYRFDWENKIFVKK